MSGNDDIKEKLKKRDKVGLLGQTLAIGAGGIAGSAASSVVATVTGANSIPILTGLGKMVGLTIVGSTPIGWTIGGAIIGAAVGYAISKVSYGGGKVDGKKEADLENLEKQK